MYVGRYTYIYINIYMYIYMYINTYICTHREDRSSLRHEDPSMVCFRSKLTDLYREPSVLT